MAVLHNHIGVTSMTLNTKTAGKTANSIISEIIDNPNDPEELNPWEIYNPLDHFEGLDYPPRIANSNPIRHPRNLRDMLKNIPSRRSAKVEFEEELETWYKLKDSDIRRQPLVLFCYLHRKIEIVKKAVGPGSSGLDDVVGIITGEKEIPEDISDADIQEAKDITDFYPRYYLIEQLASGKLSRYRQRLLQQLENFPNRTDFNLLELMQLSKTLGFYNMHDKVLNDLVDDASSIIKEDNMKYNYNRNLMLKFEETTVLSIVQRKESKYWFREINTGERICLISHDSSSLLPQLISSMKDRFPVIKMTGVTLKVWHTKIPFVLSLASILNWKTLELQ